MNNYKNMSNEEIKEQLEWSDQHEFSYGYSIWAFNELKQLKKQKEDVIQYIKENTRWFDSEYAKTYGELCTCEGINSNRLEVMKNPSDILRMLGEIDVED